MRRALAVLAVSALVALAACAGDPEESGDGGSTRTTDHAHGAAICSPSGSALTIAALPNARLAYDKDCLAVPAGADFTLSFDNQDNGVPHTVDFVNDDSATQTFFSTGQTVGPNKQTFTVPISRFPGPGTYHFRCLIHPAQMVGTFIVK